MYDDIERLLDKISFKLKKIAKNMGLNWSDFAIFLCLFTLIFVLSGGLSVLINPDLNRLIAPQITGGQSPLEFSIFLVTNSLSFISVYLIYKATSKARPDISLATIGVILLVFMILISMFLLTLKT